MLKIIGMLSMEITGIKRSSIQQPIHRKNINNLIHDEFEKPDDRRKESLQIDAKRFKELKEGDRVLVFEDDIII